MRVPPVVDSTAGPDETERVKELVHTNYKQLRELFRVYSNSMGSNNAGSADTFRISKNEFTSFCHDCRIGYGAVRSLPFNMVQRCQQLPHECVAGREMHTDTHACAATRSSPTLCMG